jgi:hypothetical protein
MKPVDIQINYFISIPSEVDFFIRVFWRGFHRIRPNTRARAHTHIWPPLWSIGQSSWLQIQRSGFDSRRYQIFWEVVGLERGSLSLMSTTEELLGINCSDSGLENRECRRRDPSRWPRNNLYPQMFALISPTSGGRSVGRVRSRTKATELLVLYIYIWERGPLFVQNRVPQEARSSCFHVGL